MENLKEHIKELFKFMYLELDDSDTSDYSEVDRDAVYNELNDFMNTARDLARVRDINKNIKKWDTRKQYYKNNINLFKKYIYLMENVIEAYDKTI